MAKLRAPKPGSKPSKGKTKAESAKPAPRAKVAAKPRGKVKVAAKPAAASPHPVSPLAPKSYPNLPPLAGVRLATGAAGVKYKNRTDVLVAVLAPGTQAAGVFTQSKTASAPVEWCRQQLKPRHRPGACGQQRQRQRLHRQGRARPPATSPNSAAAAVGCRAPRSFSPRPG